MAANIEDILSHIRSDLQHLQPYKSARSLQKSNASMLFLDANEAPFNGFVASEKFNRYPEKQPQKLLKAFAETYDVASEKILVSRGADEAIDLLIRLFGTTGRTRILICPPTFPMYEHSALLQGVFVDKVPLKEESFQLDFKKMQQQLTEYSYPLTFLCSPNNPSANLMHEKDIEQLLQQFPKTLFVVDETYFEYAENYAQLRQGNLPHSWLKQLNTYANLLVLRTLSKSHASAGLRCGAAFGHAQLIAWLQLILPPYPLPQPVIEAAVQVLTKANRQRLSQLRNKLLKQQDRLIEALKKNSQRWGVVSVYPSQANFVLVKFSDSERFLSHCHAQGIILRDQSHQIGLKGCLRISAGSQEETDQLIALLEESKQASKQERCASLQRATNETRIEVEVNLDRTTPCDIYSGIGFYDHMLEQLAKHGRFGLRFHCLGDLHIDAHHSIEDGAVALGQALKRALGNKKGIQRYGFLLPMDEAQAQVALDLSGRFAFRFQASFSDSFVGDFPTQMVEHFFYSFAENLQANLHLQVNGSNDHHKIEALFKGCGRALAQAFHKDGSDAIPSTKGIL